MKGYVAFRKNGGEVLIKRLDDGEVLLQFTRPIDPTIEAENLIPELPIDKLPLPSACVTYRKSGQIITDLVMRPDAAECAYLLLGRLLSETA